MLPVLHGDMEGVALGVEVGDDGLAPPVTVLVHDVAAIAFREELGIVVIPSGPRARPGADPDRGSFRGVFRHRGCYDLLTHVGQSRRTSRWTR
ncbi:hypothetical protein Nans01_40750 [Nocardiopsis ansamitocini]|uniref:Uncharacterized protein n=1 Tax=Nocardiopsis ansamitocini TaxID=1670832 RepID=A0A9W6P8V4_9ACTN|nr:hypothetical protein Nans01_40750 [Nocardiopsis ansamitocini]